MCSAPSQKYSAHRLPQPLPIVGRQPNAMPYHHHVTTGNGLTGPNHFAVPPPPLAKRRSSSSDVSAQTIGLAFSVLFCVSICLLTVALCYKWNADTNRQIDRLVGTVEEVIHDLNTFTAIVREEIVAKRVDVDAKRAEQRKDKSAETDGGDYSDLEEEDYDSENRFMGRDLLDNNWPKTVYRANESSEQINRKRRNAEVNTKNIVKNDLTGANSENLNGNSEPQESSEEITVKPYTTRKSKKIGLKKKPITEPEEEIFEDLSETGSGTYTAAHFISDSTKYSTRLHPHYQGNGRLKHPDGDFRDWTQYLWDPKNNDNANTLVLKNGKVEILKSGLYFVYAQIYYSDSHDINGYYVMKNDDNVLGCTTTRHRDTQSDSCYTAALVYFNYKDILSIKGLDSERYIILDPLKSFFGLFKVSNDNKKR